MAISLIMLLLLTLIGVTGSQVTGLEEKMAGNMKDRNIAFQAAESALRDAVQDIQVRASGISNFFVNCNMDNIANTADDGLCDRKWGSPGYTEPTYARTSISWPAFTDAGNNYPAITLDMTTTPSVAYGSFTGATPIAGLSAQPRYIIEGDQAPRTGSDSTQAIYFYRITARAQGANPNTVVWLQTIIFVIP